MVYKNQDTERTQEIRKGLRAAGFDDEASDSWLRYPTRYQFVGIVSILVATSGLFLAVGSQILDIVRPDLYKKSQTWAGLGTCFLGTAGLVYYLTRKKGRDAEEKLIALGRGEGEEDLSSILEHL